MDDPKNATKTALTTTKEEFTSEYQTISMMQESNAQIQMKINHIIQTENQQNQTIIKQENDRTETKNNLEIERENFLLETKQKNDQLAKDRLNLLNEMHQIDDKRLLLLQKADYNQHIIDNLKSQEEEYNRLETIYQNQYLQADSMIKSLLESNEKQSKDLLNKSMISKKDEKINQLKQSIQNLEQLLNETKEKRQLLLDKGQNLRKEIVNYRDVQMNKFLEKIDDESQNVKKYNNIAFQVQDKTDTINLKINMIKRQINEIDNQFIQVTQFINSQKDKISNKYDKINEIKQNASDTRQKAAESREKSTNILHNHSLLQKIQSDSKKVSAKFKTKCDELTNMYKTETKLNKMLPELLTASCEADASLAEIENALSQINQEIENQDFSSGNIEEQINHLQKDLLEVEEKLKKAKAEEAQLKLMINIDNSDDSISFNNFKRIKTEKEIKIKTKIKSVKKHILSILLQIKEQNLVLDRQRRSKDALLRIMRQNKSLYDSLKESHENNINPIFQMQSNGKAKKIENQIRNLQIRISTKKEVIKTMKNNLYAKSSLLIHTVHKSNRSDLASTNTMNCDPETKSLILKNHDKFCGIEHECTALNLLCKLESSKDYCIFCNKYNVPVV